MANLISDMIGMATPAVVEKIASSFGLSSAAVTSLVGTAVPSIMGALINKGSTAGGAKDILSSLSGASPNLTSAVASGNLSALAAQGTAMVSSLIGNSGFSTLSNAVASNAGVPAAAGASVMGLASQMVMSGLAKNAVGLDGAGLSSLLASQKASVQHMLPSSLGSILGMSGMAGASSMAASAMGTPTSTPRTTTTATSNTVRDRPSQTQASMADTNAGAMDWLKFAIPVALIALAAWYFLDHRGTGDVAAVKPAATATAPAAPATSATAGDADVGKNFTGALGDLSASLGGITDVATAQAALLKLQGAGTTISTIAGLAAKFTPEQKTTVTGLLNDRLPGITAAATKAEGIDGVGAVLKPVIDPILANLTMLTK